MTRRLSAVLLSLLASLALAAPAGAVSFSHPDFSSTGAHNAIHDVLSWRFGKDEPAPVTPVAEKQKPVKKCPPRRAKKGKRQKERPETRIALHSPAKRLKANGPPKRAVCKSEKAAERRLLPVSQRVEYSAPGGVRFQ